MSPVFGHGRLRLYLLKLLEESPRHGYEVIRILQDRFLGVYSPSPGTIYPRLARLEAEGLVTHEVVKGKKVYSLTDKGREELERRMDELAELEEEITASAQEFARGVQQDVRQAIVGYDETITLRHVEPLDPSGNLDEIERLLQAMRCGCVNDVACGEGILAAQRTSSQERSTRFHPTTMPSPTAVFVRIKVYLFPAG